MLGLPRSSAGSALGLLEVISSAHRAALARSFRLHTPLLCAPACRGESSVCLPFCSLHYHADNIRLFSRKVWDPCSFPRLSSCPWKEEKQRGACYAPSRQAMGWRWCNARWVAAAKLVMLCPGMAWPSPAPRRTKAPRGEHSEADKVPAKHEAEGDVPLGTGTAPSSRPSAGPQPARCPDRAGEPARGAGDDDDDHGDQC